MMALLKLLATLGVQSLRAHKTKSLIVGGLMGFGAFLVVLGGSLQSSLERSMRMSIVESVTGDVQMYAKDAKDQLAMFGGMNFGSEDLGEIKKISDVKDKIAAHPNVKAVIPMGIANGTFSTPGDLDRALNDLRDAVRAKDSEKTQSIGARVRQIANVMKDQARSTAELSKVEDAVDRGAVLDRATSDELWAQMQTDPLAALDWMDSKLAPLGDQGGIVYLRMIGTDLPAFQKNFGKLKVVEGQMVPAGKRGLIIGKKGLDANVKMSLAKTLDTIKLERDKGKTISEDRLLQELVQRNVRQARRILYYLSPADEGVVADALRKAMPESRATELVPLLQDFMNVTDETFDDRFKLFYDVIGPRVQLYPFKVGDTISLSSFTKSGYVRSVNVKVWGTYEFEGLESSDLAGGLSLVDMVTFRELYGQRTAAFDAELQQMRSSVAAKEVAREDAEAALFGDDSVEATAPPASDAAAAPRDHADAPVVSERLITREERAAALDAESFTQADIDNGLSLSLSVQLKDPSQLSQTLSELSAIGEPLGLQAIDWQRAAGFVGQLIWVIRGILSIAILIIFIVAIVIINNSMVMATLERVAEIGTLRALGAQKWFVTAMILFETGVLGVLAGTLGAALAAGVVLWLGQVGIPAGSDILVFLFGGPRLYPSVGAGAMVFGVGTSTFVAVLATLYPARLATRIQPVVAMQGKE